MSSRPQAGIITIDMTKKQKQPQNTDKDLTQEEIEKFSQELTQKLSQISTPNKKSKTNKRTLSIKVNPLIIIVTVILGIFVVFSLLNRQFFLDKTTLDNLIKGLNDNQYSQLLVQDDGKIVANGKYYVFYEGSVGDNVKSTNDTKVLRMDTSIKKVEFNEFVDYLKPEGLVNELRTFLNSNNQNVEKIIIGDNFILGITGGTSKDILLENVNEQTFSEKLEESNINLSDLKIEVRNINVFGKKVEEDSFSSRLESQQFSRIFQLDNVAIGEINNDYVEKVYIDWTPNINSFTEVLQNEGISLSSKDFQIVSVNVPAGISLDDILTILTLIGFVVLGIIIFRGAQSSGMGLMQFGQSKAKMYFGSKTNTSFKDVAGIDEARDELNEIVDFLRNPGKYTSIGARIPKGILMFGPPGTGKTLLARAIAGEAAVPFFHTSGSEFEEMLVGAGASRVRDLFAKAKKAAPSLIFIDEIDAVARKRGTRIQSGSTEQTLNQILVEMDGFETNTNVIVIAATNRPDVLDPAILRPGRFDRQVRIEVPDVEGRKQILAIHASNKKLDSTVDLERIAKRTVGFTGADLENIMNEAAIIAAGAGKKTIGMHDVEEAVSKVVLGPAKRSRKRTDDELKLVAYHEAGHAIVAKFTPKSTPVDKISIVSRGGTGGVTMFLPEKDENIISKAKLLADVTVSLGGRAAEEVVLGDISTGASNDIKQATRVTRKMIQQFGMNEKLGLVEYGDHADSDFLGYDYADSKDYSEKTAEIIDEEVRIAITAAYANAKKIIVEQRAKLDELASLLLEKEVIDKEEFDKLF